jgi:hypothetical protein
MPDFTRFAGLLGYSDGARFLLFQCSKLVQAIGVNEVLATLFDMSGHEMATSGDDCA